ncbi:MAG: polyphosphate polymerase domain-containing protein [Anaerolineales bacterium]|nr:polyphosphate polymerase domain-containing protein [Anaerolineales bacterium]
MKYRHEMKYIINYRDHALIRSRLRNVLSSDANVEADGSYTVRSLYFDDYNNRAYEDKYAGVLKRAKHRIRIYNYSDKRISFEKKNKIGQYNNKQTAAMTKEQVDAVVRGDYSVLLSSSSDLLKVFYHECMTNLMRPRVVVDYEREPYVMAAGDVRITFDKNIRAGVDGFDIFDSKMPVIETLEPGLLVMEVKFTEFLPNIVREILSANAANYTTVSKYVLCCDKTNHRRYSQI